MPLRARPVLQLAVLLMAVLAVQQILRVVLMRLRMELQRGGRMEVLMRRRAGSLGANGWLLRLSERG